MTELIIGFAAVCVFFAGLAFFIGRSTRTTRKTTPLLGVVLPQKKDGNDE